MKIFAPVDITELIVSICLIENNDKRYRFRRVFLHWIIYRGRKCIRTQKRFKRKLMI